MAVERKWYKNFNAVCRRVLELEEATVSNDDDEFKINKEMLDVATWVHHGHDTRRTFLDDEEKTGYGVAGKSILTDSDVHGMLSPGKIAGISESKNEQVHW